MNHTTFAPLAEPLEDPFMAGAPMGKPVFISYARRASRNVALRLYAALGAEQVFLDSENIEDGDRFPRVLAEAVLDARVVVVFGGPAYLSRWYCLREFKLALLPLDLALRCDPATSTSRLTKYCVTSLSHCRTILWGATGSITFRRRFARGVGRGPARANVSCNSFANA